MAGQGSWNVKIQYFFSRHITSPRPHQFMYQLTGGLIGSRLPTVRPRVLLLTTRGRKSGRLRTTPVAYVRDGDRLVIAATNNGGARHPAWRWNLKASPQALVQVGRNKNTVIAHEAVADERQRLWALMTDVDPLFAEYQKRTARAIPVIILTPVRVSDREARQIKKGTPT